MRLIREDSLIDNIRKYVTIENTLPGENFKTFEAAREMAISLIETASTIDALPVVRCKDCINYDDGLCSRYGWVENDHYCADGKRRDIN